MVPRIFSPNGDGINDGVYFQLTNPTQSQISGIVLDMSGAKVAEINVSPTGEADLYYWNGRDENGCVVPAGPYIYRIDGEGGIVSGVVVVAR
ncbi:MAG: gliding motility-associated C-terminal domain-containing protein [Elusimicrobia bacterium]|nr:gliding motility-associated C-terminal domain-containing protein [Elusimicrobiota bacterium]